MLKRLSLVSKRSGIERAQFVEHWRQKHPVFVKQLAGLIAYRQSLVLQPVIPLSEGYDLNGFAELWFEDAEAMRRAMSSPAGQALPGDEKEFLGAITTFATNATDPHSANLSHYVIGSPSNDVERDVAGFESAIRSVPEVVRVESSVVRDTIRRPPPPLTVQDIGFFAGLQFEPNADPRAILSGVQFAGVVSSLKKRLSSVWVVEVEQFRVV